MGINRNLTQPRPFRSGGKVRRSLLQSGSSSGDWYKPELDQIGKYCLILYRFIWDLILFNTYRLYITILHNYFLYIYIPSKNLFLISTNLAPEEDNNKYERRKNSDNWQVIQDAQPTRFRTQINKLETTQIYYVSGSIMKHHQILPW